MDTGRVIEELRSFVVMTALHRPPPTPGIVHLGDNRVTQGSNDEIVAAAQVVEPLLDVVLPAWRTSAPEDKTRRWQQHRQAAQRAIVKLERQADVEEMLGDVAPQISAAGLHPWIWDSARSLWQSGHRSQAVLAAAVKVNAETQNKLGRRDLSETDLFRAAFSASPAKPGDPRLRLPGDDGGKTAQSQRRGVMAFAEGCYAAIRNPIGHDPTTDLDESEALEKLAAFSILARWVESSTIDSA